jgi:hypothetical protein
MKTYKFYYFELKNPKQFQIAEFLCATKDFAIALFKYKFPVNEYTLFAIEG